MNAIAQSIADWVLYREAPGGLECDIMRQFEQGRDNLQLEVLCPTQEDLNVTFNTFELLIACALGWEYKPWEHDPMIASRSDT
jgi:hypothetical protein